MSENPNTADNFDPNDEIDPLEQAYQDGSYHDENEIVNPEVIAGIEPITLAKTPIPQAREVILPVIMRKKDDIAILGDASFDPETNKMVVSFNTEAGREIAEFIGSGILAAVSFAGHISAESFNRN